MVLLNLLWKFIPRDERNDYYFFLELQNDVRRFLMYLDQEIFSGKSRTFPGNVYSGMEFYGTPKRKERRKAILGLIIATTNVTFESHEEKYWCLEKFFETISNKKEELWQKKRRRGMMNVVPMKEGDYRTSKKMPYQIGANHGQRTWIKLSGQ